MRTRSRFVSTALPLVLALGACTGMMNRDPLAIDVAGIEPLPGQGMELRLAVKIRVQNPNDQPVEFTGAALELDLNGRSLASGVSDAAGTVPRYGETVLTVPVTISAFDMARQALGLMNAGAPESIPYKVRGKLEAGVFGTRRFSDEGTLDLPGTGARPAQP